jgi:splicing factor 3A subunit 3
VATLELMRSLHEEIEREQALLVKELNAAPHTLAVQTAQAQRVRGALSLVEANAKRLMLLYTSDERLADAGSLQLDGAQVFGAFYERLRELKESHRKHPRTVADADAAVLQSVEAATRSVRFSGEESYGRYLDLHALHERFVELKRLAKKAASGASASAAAAFSAPDYAFYLARFAVFDDGMWRSFDRKLYEAYLDELRAYLVSFIERTNPLFDLAGERDAIRRDFAERHAAGTFVSWPASAADAVNGGADDPLYCRPCARRFAKATVFAAHLDGKSHRAALERAGDAAARKLPPTALLALEHEITMLAALLEPTIEATMVNVERKLSLTADERQAELDQEAAEIEADEAAYAGGAASRTAGAAAAAGGGGGDDDDDDKKDKPLLTPQMTIDNYPVGWDGKPIPYWLYRLHGLGVEYKCEICANTSYWGLKNFQLHFQQWRHAQGMAALGIPNTRHFQDITSIADAQALWRTMQQTDKQKTWRTQDDEEFEDEDGNVYARKTFLDLQRQGLLSTKRKK